MAYATLGRNGRITIPKPVRDRLGLKAGTRLQFVRQDDGTALVVPMTLHVADLIGCLPPPKRPASLKDMKSAIRGCVSKRKSEYAPD